MPDKIIVTNRAALEAKYGSPGYRDIETAVAALIKADEKRGIQTKLMHLDDSEALEEVGGTPVTTISSVLQNKRAIDAIYRHYEPDYLMILGAPDVVPHQQLDNRAYDPSNDDDVSADGDLPYACEAGYSKDPARFVGPTRVVGRLPDLVGADQPGYLIKLLGIAANYQQRSAEDYAAYFGLSAEVWEGSTTLSLEHIFGDASRLQLAPPSGPVYAKGELSALAHFINCHGARVDPKFYGEDRQGFHVSMTTSDTLYKIREGTVATAECCFGVELYDAVMLASDMPICQTYLEQGAYGYLGSSTISYGPVDSNGAADILCQEFLAFVLQGASLGRALLMARQEFVRLTSQMDPIDLKTLSQFFLLGDPSIHPVAPSVTVQVPAGTDEDVAARFRRSERRENMKRMGEILAKTQPTASKEVDAGGMSEATRKALTNIAKKAGIEDGDTFTAFAVKLGTSRVKSDTKSGGQPSRYFLKVWKPEDAPKYLNLGICIVAKEQDGRIMDSRIYRQR